MIKARAPFHYKTFYINKSRKYKKLCFIRMKSQCIHTTPGGIPWGLDFLMKSQQIAAFYFVKDRVPYHLSISTCKYEQQLIAHSKAFSLVASQLTKEEADHEFEFNFKKVKIGGQTCYELERNEPAHYEKFENRTFNEESERLAQQFIGNDPLPQPSCQIDFACQYAISIDAVVDVDEITDDFVAQFIDEIINKLPSKHERK